MSDWTCGSWMGSTRAPPALSARSCILTRPPGIFGTQMVRAWHPWLPVALGGLGDPLCEFLAQLDDTVPESVKTEEARMDFSSTVTVTATLCN